MEKLARQPLLVILVAKCGLNLAFANRYGWQRDELYYAVAGRHLQGGYVDFPPVTALLSALARISFGWSLVGFRSFAILAGAGTVLVAALIARELGGDWLAQTIAAGLVAFSPVLLAANGLFQPVSFDQTATILVLWLALRLALGRGSWLALGIAAGVGLETKYTLAVVLILLVACFAGWRRDVLASRGFLLALAVVGVLMIPNLLWEASHGWISVHWFLHPPGSATDESRAGYLLNLLLQTNPFAAPVAVAGIVALTRDPRLRPIGAAVAAVPVLYFVLGAKSYYAAPAMFFALAAGAVPFARWATRWRFAALALGYAAVFVIALPHVVPIFPLKTAIKAGVIKARSDYQDELGWPALAVQVEGAVYSNEPMPNVVIARNYGEAGALEMFGAPGLPPIVSADATFRYWPPFSGWNGDRPNVHGQNAVLVGFSEAQASHFCYGYKRLDRIRMPTANEERGRPILACQLKGKSFDTAWPDIVRTTGA